VGDWSRLPGWPLSSTVSVAVNVVGACRSRDALEHVCGPQGFPRLPLVRVHGVHGKNPSPHRGEPPCPEPLLLRWRCWWQAALPPPAVTVATEMSTTTTAPTVATESTTTSATTTTTTVPTCELGTALDAVWMIETGDGHGTAFHIGDGEWITAAHVVGHVETVLLRHGADEIEATVVGIDHDTDVAVLGAAIEAPNVLLALDAVGVGADVLAAGYPLYGESEPSVTRGVVSRLERDIFLGELLLTDTAMNPGNSGGPLFTECGTVAGMVVQKIVDVDVEGIGYAVTASELTSQMPRLRSGYRTVIDEPEPVSVVPATTVPVQGWYINYVDGIPYAQADALVWDGPQTTPSSPPQLWVSCLDTRKWLLYWPHADIYTTPSTDLVATGR